MLALLVACGVVFWIVSGEPRHKGHPVFHWATHHSLELYPSSGSPQVPSRKGLDALHEMGPKKAATALVLPVSRTETRFSRWYQSMHPRLPAGYQKRFPLGLTHHELRLMALGAVDFLDPDYQRTVVPFLVSYLEKPNRARQEAACQLLAEMPAVAASALPALERLAQSTDPEVRGAARSARDRIARALPPP
jgi:hypothetical protein